MERKVITTADGSSSLFVPAINEHYHSRHGAIQESEHVFIQQGFLPQIEGKTEISILELGFGTGLNAFLTAMQAQKQKVLVHYFAVEAFPLQKEEIAALNYTSFFDGNDSLAIWEAIHNANWEEKTRIHDLMQIQKMHQKFEALNLNFKVDLVYFDAFAPEKQAELWTIEIFEKMFAFLNPGGRLATYCAKGEVRRTMQAAGFSVARVPGPPGKREMLVASKS